MFNVSQTAIEQVLNDMRTGKDAEYVARFWASRPEWLDQDNETSGQDNKPVASYKGVSPDLKGEEQD